MESVVNQVKILVDRSLFLTAGELRDCNVDEESDMYGFSLISQREDRRELGRGQTQTTTLAMLKMDQNWNNPGAVCLMCRAYQLDDTYHSVAFGNAFRATQDTYKTLKSEQHAMFAERYYAEGVVAKGRGLFIESVKSFSDALLYRPDHVLARIERADSYYRQNKKAEALSDYKHILSVQPNHTVALERVALLRDNTSFSTPHTPSTSTGRIQLVDPNAHTSLPSFPSSSALSDTSSKNIHAKPLVYKTQGLIGKIQQSLLDNPTYFDTSSGDSSSESDSDSGSEKSSRKRKHKSSKKDKRSHSDKSSKKRKSKHKKDKHSKKKKHKSDK